MTKISPAADEADKLVFEAFDESFYLNQFEENPPAKAFEHYLETGWKRGLDPAPWFSTRAYLERYQDVRTQGMNPFRHYVNFGQAEGRLPEPSAVLQGAVKQADPATVHEKAVSVASGNSLLGESVSAHAADAAPFESFGEQVMQSSAPILAADKIVFDAFDKAFYLDQFEDDPPAGAFEHYLETGWKHGLDPAPWFSTRSYLERYPDVRKQGLNPFRHYLSFGQAEGRLPEPSSVLQGAIKKAAPAAVDEKAVSEAFDTTYYLAQCAGCSSADALEHYLRIGWKRGLDPSPSFSTRAYLDRYPDIREAGVNPFFHYILFGQGEGREAEPSSLLPSPARILQASGEVDHSVAMLLEQALQHPQADSLAVDASVWLSRYLLEEWRTIETQQPRTWRTPALRRDISAAVKCKIFAAASRHTSDSRLCAELAAIANTGHYRQRCEMIGIAGPDAFGTDVVTHYLAIGRHFRISLTPIFDIAHYVDTVKRSELGSIDPANAFIHYLSIGEKEGLRPCAFFNPRYYDANYGPFDGSALAHYVEIGAKLGHDPSPVFWGAWYRKTNNISATNPLEHFFQFGIELGLRVNPLLDLGWYAQQNDLGAESSAIKHYVSKGFVADLSPHPLIDPSYVKKQASRAKLKRHKGETTIELYMRNARRLDPHPLFDAAYYLRNCNDPEALAQPLAHYIQTSCQNHRFPNPYFSDKTYYEARGDVLDAKVPALKHYVLSGYKECAKVHPLVDHDFLRSSLLDLGSKSVVEALVTGLVGDKSKLRRITAHPDTENRSKWLPVALDVERAAKACPPLSVEAGAKVGVLAHVFYVSLLPEVIAFVRNFPPSASLLVSTDTAEKREEIIAQLEESGLENFEVRALENRGRDIAPSFFGFADRIEKLDYGVHIHTKRSPHYGSAFDKWRSYLFAENGGSHARVDAILRVFEANPTLGAIAPVDFGPIRKLISWGYNQDLAQSLLELLGWRGLVKDLSLEFPSGSMFWFRVKALGGLYRAGLRRYHFDPEESQIDGTLAHVIERTFFMLIETEGYDWLRICSGERLGGYAVTEHVAFARSRLLPPSSKLVNPVAAKLPETAPFFCRAVESSRPRLNLLLPTCDLQQGYAGVSEAIRQFCAIGERLDADLRIIATDVPFNKMTVPPQGFTNFDSLVYERDMSVVPGYLRSKEPLSLRRNDRFVASAWWNAKQAFELIDAQAAIFGSADRRRAVYLIQDFEPGFYPWSTRWALAESTYRQPEKTIAVFNTPLLSDFMAARYAFSATQTYRPMINEQLMIARDQQPAFDTREKIVLLYARVHAERNCLEMIDAVVACCLERDPDFWAEWRFLAIGETFNARLLSTRAIKVLGRLTMADYKDYLARARLGVSLMVSPHPSYPPLEMAANGVRVLTNTYEGKDLSRLHGNIESFGAFDPPVLASRLKAMAQEDRQPGMPLVDWFFNGQNNLDSVAESVAMELRRDLDVAKPAVSTYGTRP